MNKFLSQQIDRLSLRQLHKRKSMVSHFKAPNMPPLKSGEFCSYFNTLIGVSLGGFLTNLTSTVESDIDILISVFYANSLATSIWDTIPGKYIKNDFIQNSFSYDQLINHWAVITPSLYQPAVTKNRILLLSAAYDQYINLEDSNELWAKWGKPRRNIYNCGHSGIVLLRNKIRKDSLEFINSKLQAGGLHMLVLFFALWIIAGNS